MQNWINKLFKIKDTPEALARGAAIGWFFGVSIFWGLQILLAVGVSHLLKGNKVIAAVMTAVSNPFTTLPLYSVAYIIGHAIIHDTDPHIDFAVTHSVEGFMAVGPAFLLAMFAGTALLGLGGAVLIYLAIRIVMKDRQCCEAVLPNKSK